MPWRDYLARRMGKASVLAMLTVCCLATWRDEFRHLTLVSSLYDGIGSETKKQPMWNKASPPSPPRTHMSKCMCLCVYGLHDVQPAYLFKEIFDLSHSVLWMPFHVNKIKCPSALSLYSFHTPVHALVSHFPKSTAEVIPAGSTQGQCFRHIRKLIYRIITCNSIV